mgnify:CR=1 FL=1
MSYTTIDKSSTHFAQGKYSGNGATGRAINTGLDLSSGGLQVVKEWSDDTGAWFVNDSERNSGTKYLQFESTSAGAVDTNVITSLNNNGFTVGNDVDVNDSGDTYVHMGWKAPTNSGASGYGLTLDSYKINTTAKFGIYKYTGNGSAGAYITHGLGGTPAFALVKKINGTTNWRVFHHKLGNTKHFVLNDIQGAYTDNSMWNNTSPDSTKFYFGTSSSVNGSGDEYIAYIWCEVKGFSKFGSQSCNNPVFVHTGFAPAFLSARADVNNTGEYAYFADNPSRNFNRQGRTLFPASNAVNYDYGDADSVSFLSNGFYSKKGGSPFANSGGTFYYWCFAQAPLVGSNNVPCVARWGKKLWVKQEI